MRNLFVVIALSVYSFAQGVPYPYTVTSSWVLSTTSPSLVAGQNVYYTSWGSSVCGTTWTKLNSTILGNSVTTYTDATVSPARDGGSYCYGVTAVGTNGAESSKDSISPVLIPPAPPTGFTGTVAVNKTASNVTWAWKQSPGTIKYNELLCAQKPGGLYSERWKSTVPEIKAILSMVPGTHECVVTAFGANGLSGASKPATVVVQ